MNLVEEINKIINEYQYSTMPPLTVDVISKKIGYSKFHMSREYKKLSGIGVGKAVSNKKMEIVRKSLLNGDVQLKAAMNAGIDSAQSLIRKFKHDFDITPGGYARVNKSPQGAGESDYFSAFFGGHGFGFDAGCYGKIDFDALVCFAGVNVRLGDALHYLE